MSSSADGSKLFPGRRSAPGWQTRAKTLLKLATPLAAMVVTLAAALTKTLIQWLPRLQPIVLVLVFFFGLLGVLGLLQLYLHWRDLGTSDARSNFMRTVAYALFLFVVMVGGMFARYFWELFQSGLTLAQADVTTMLLPLLVSLMVFYPLWTLVSGAPKDFFAVVAAFQNGFFWQTIFSGLRPFTAPGP